MQRLSARFVRVGAAFTVLLSVCAQAWAIPPIVLRQFTFDTDTSRLHVTGGFAGIDEMHPIAGDFGLAIGYEQGFVPPHIPSLDPFAAFVDVNATLLGEGLLGGADLNSLLNLTGLDGAFDITNPGAGLLFTGLDGQGAPVSISATLEDKRLHLVGRNTPGCCDFFSYQLDAFATIPLFGDLSGDGFVGIEDLNLVLSGFGQPTTPFATADPNWDGYVGIEDLNVVLTDWNAGASPGTGEGSQVVPEPVAAGLLLAAASVCLVRRPSPRQR